ncbi:MAG: T9SS type A sorting domain-containing protein, partial [Flavobacterium sp.]
IQSYTFTKAYIPALSNFAISDNSTNIVLTVQGSSLTDTYEAFLDADNNSSTGFIDPTWSPMGADYMIQNGSLYSYSGTANAWGWTLVQSGLQVNNSTINTDLYQREILIQRSKLSTLAVGNTIKGGYRSVVNGATSAVKPTAGGVMLNHVMTTTYVSDLQSIAVTDDTSNIIVTVTGGNLSTTYQVYLNSDNVAASGLIDGTWDSTGIEYLIENGLLYSYSGTGTNWSWTSISGSLTVINSTVSGVTTRTITIPKVSLENLAGIIKVGYRNIVSGSLSGKLPADNSMFSFTLLPTLQQIGESGTLTFTQTSKDTWFTKTLLQTYNNPVVILSPVSFDNADPAIMRVKNVTNNSFEYQLDEWDYLDGVHPSSTIYYMVVEAGRYTLDGGVVMEAGVKQLNNKWSNVKFGSTFATVPLVLAQTMSYNAPTAVTSRIRYIETSNLEMKIQEEEANDYINNRVRTSETVGYVAITQGSGNFGFPFETDGTNRSYNNQFKSIWFNDDVSTKSSVFAHMQTSYSGNTAALRYKSLSTSKFSVKVEEEQSYDFETAHTDEEVGYLVLGGSGVFQGIATESNGTSTAKKAISTKQVVNTILDENFGLSFYPNPVDHFLNLESDNLIKQLSVFNINGQLIYTDQQQEKEKSISTESWTKGIYIVKALLDNGKTNIVKVVKR